MILLSLFVQFPQHWSAPLARMAQVYVAPCDTRVKGPGVTLGALGGIGRRGPDGGW